MIPTLVQAWTAGAQHHEMCPSLLWVAFVESSQLKKKKSTGKWQIDSGTFKVVFGDDDNVRFHVVNLKLSPSAPEHEPYFWEFTCIVKICHLMSNGILKDVSKMTITYSEGSRKKHSDACPGKHTEMTVVLRDACVHPQSNYRDYSATTRHMRICG